MGSCVGPFSPNDAKPGQGTDIVPMCLELGYSRLDINTMFKSFRLLDVYNNGTISVKAYCAIYKLSDAFGKTIFRKMLGAGRQDTMNFEEYLLSTWNALSFFDEHSLAIFTFRIFDTDGSGEMTPNEVNRMVQVIWGDRSKSNKQVVDALNSHMGKRNSVDAKAFITLSNDFPILLLPIFDLLRTARKHTLGEGRWKELAHRRKENSGDSAPTHFGNLKDISPIKGKRAPQLEDNYTDITMSNKQ